MAFTCNTLAALVTLLIGSSRASVCIGNCPPNCNDYIANGRHTGCLGGQMCSYECDQGYETTTEVLTCRDGGLKPFGPWGLHDEPLCKLKPCPEVIPNGRLSENCTAKVGFNCRYTCDLGYYKLSGIKEIKCDSTTKWSPNPHSLCTHYYQCPYEIPGGDLDLSCRRIWGEQCEYTCRKGYVHSHYATADCRSNGNWMPRIDSFCVEIKCPLFLEHGIIQYPCTMKYGETCNSYKCSSSYTKPSLPPSLKCQLDHRNTTGFWEWNKAMGQPCVRKVDVCPSTFLNGNVSSECHRQPGAECSYTCKTGCDRNPAVTTIHCRQSSGIWMENTSTLCTNCIHCPFTFENGQVLSSCKRIPSTDCSYTCNNGCRKVVSTLYCTDEGEWSNPRPCICFIVSESEDSVSSNPGVVIAIVVVVAFVILSSVCIFRYKQRQRMNRQATSANELENRAPMIPSAPLATDNEESHRYPGSRAAQIQEPATDIDISNGSSGNPGAGNDTTSPPPSYEEVTADPTKFNIANKWYF